MKKVKTNLKAGDLIYLKDVGYPYNRTDDSGETWEGASGIILNVHAGYNRDMIEVETLLPVKTSQGDVMKTCLFHDKVVKKENRPWLKKHLSQILKFKQRLLYLVDEIKGNI